MESHIFAPPTLRPRSGFRGVWWTLHKVTLTFSCKIWLLLYQMMRYVGFCWGVKNLGDAGVPLPGVVNLYDHVRS